MLEGGGERLSDHEPQVRDVEALVITFGQTEAAGLVEIDLRVRKLLSTAMWAGTNSSDTLRTPRNTLSRAERCMAHSRT